MTLAVVSGSFPKLSLILASVFKFVLISVELKFLSFKYRRDTCHLINFSLLFYYLCFMHCRFNSVDENGPYKVCYL